MQADLAKRIANLETWIAALEKQRTNMAIQEAFWYKDRFHALAEQLRMRSASSELIASAVDEEHAWIARIKQMTLALYSEQELEAARELGVSIAETLAADEKMLPLEAAISDAYEFKLFVPAVAGPNVQWIHARPVAELFGITVIWDDASQTATFVDGETVITLAIGSEIAYVNGLPVSVDAEPRLVGGYTYVPVDFLVQMLRLKVNWDLITETIEIRI